MSKRRNRAIVAMLVAGLVAASSLGATPVARDGESPLRLAASPVDHADLSVLTYNVKGLPWPVAQGRPAAIRAIGDRLAQMRKAGRQPTVVVLQEAFTQDAKAIGDRAGYAYQVEGPYLRAAAGVQQGDWYLGETVKSALDSGLIILSDVPITSIARAEFPTGACAGYDCIAAKGVVLTTIDIPGRGLVEIATTHLNSRGASGAPFPRTHAAYGKQVDYLASFLRAHRNSDKPLIVAGDFNRAQRPERIELLTRGMGGAREALAEAVQRVATVSGLADARKIVSRARDMQFVFNGRRHGLQVLGAEVPFGTEAGGEALSDHMGFTVHYRLVARSPAL